MNSTANCDYSAFALQFQAGRTGFTRRSSVRENQPEVE